MKEEFFEMAKNSVILSSEIVDVERLLSDSSKLNVENPLQVKYETYISILLPERPVPLTEVLDEISPLLFAGLINVSEMWRDIIYFKPLKK